MELELKDYITIFKKRLGLIVSLVIIFALVTGTISYLFLKPVYESSTKLIVNNSRHLSDSLDINSVNLDIRLVDTYKQIIKTTAITDKVAERNPDFALTGEQILNLLNISSVNNTQVLTISAKHNNYELTVNLVNEVANVFVEEIPKIMTVDNVTILEDAKKLENPSPVAPNPILNIAISIIVALMLGIGIALLLEYLDDSIKDEKDVLQYISLPVLISIPKLMPGDLEVGRANNQISLSKGDRNVSS